MEADPEAARASRLRGFLSALPGLGEGDWRAVAQRHFELSGSDEAEQARLACRQAALDSGRLKEWKAAGDRGWEAARGADRLKRSGPRPSFHLEARAAARLAAGALVVRDLTGEEGFALVYQPFAEVLPPG